MPLTLKLVVSDIQTNVSINHMRSYVQQMHVVKYRRIHLITVMHTYIKYIHSSRAKTVQ